MRTIDADALLERIKKDPLFPLVEEYGISGVIKAEPTVEAEPTRHGHWIGLTDSNFTCSECKETIYTWIGRRNNYCPNCGAKMDERKEE